MNLIKFAAQVQTMGPCPQSKCVIHNPLLQCFTSPNDDVFVDVTGTEWDISDTDRPVAGLS